MCSHYHYIRGALFPLYTFATFLRLLRGFENNLQSMPKSQDIITTNMENCDMNLTARIPPPSKTRVVYHFRRREFVAHN